MLSSLKKVTTPIPVNLASTTEVTSEETPTNNEVSEVEEVKTYNIEITNNTIENNLLGIGVLNTNNVLVSGNTVRDSLAGIAAYATDGLDITNNNFYGPYFEISSGLLSLGNSNLNASGNFFDGYAYGILSIGGTDNTFNLNEIDDSYYVGIGLQGETGVTVTNNDIFGYNFESDDYFSYFYGIQASDVAGSTITGNNIYDMDTGIELSGESTGTNTISNNIIDGSYTGINIVTNAPEILESDSEVSDVESDVALLEEADALPQIIVSGNNIYAYGESQTQDRQSIGINVEEAYGNVALSNNYIEYSNKGYFYDGCFEDSVLCYDFGEVRLQSQSQSRDVYYMDNTGSDIGIRIVGTDGVTSTNDEVANFALGIYADTANDLVVDNAYIYETSDFADDYYGGFSTKLSNRASSIYDDVESDYGLDPEFTNGNTFGIVAVSSDNVDIKNSEVANYDYGIYAKEGSNITIDNNLVHAKEVYAPIRQEEVEEDAVIAEENIDNEILEKQVVAMVDDSMEGPIEKEPEIRQHTGISGISLFNADTSIISNNTSRNNSTGISSAYSTNSNITGNTVSDNFFFGINSASTGSFNISNNIVSDSLYGIYAIEFFSQQQDSADETLLGVISNNNITTSSYGIYAIGQQSINFDINSNIVTIIDPSLEEPQSVFQSIGSYGISLINGDGSITDNTVTTETDGTSGIFASTLVFVAQGAEGIAIDDNTLTAGTNYQGSIVEIFGTQGVTMSGNNINGGLVGLKLSSGTSESEAGITASSESASSISIDSISADVEFTGANNFSNNETYIALDQGIMVGETLDASGSFFDGIQGSSMSADQVAFAEGKALDVEDFDVEDRGDVFFGSGSGTLQSSAIDQVNQQQAVDFRNLFSYAGNTIDVDPSQAAVFFNSLNLNLSLLSSSGLVSGSGIDFANLAPAAGSEVENTASCLNSFLSTGFNPGFNVSACGQ